MKNGKVRNQLNDKQKFKAGRILYQNDERFCSEKWDNERVIKFLSSECGFTITQSNFKNVVIPCAEEFAEIDNKKLQYSSFSTGISSAVGRNIANRAIVNRMEEIWPLIVELGRKNDIKFPASFMENI